MKQIKTHSASLLVALMLVASAAAHAADLLTPFSSSATDEPPAPWRVGGLPGSSKPVSRFEIVSLEGKRILRIQNDNSHGLLRQDFSAVEVGAGSTLRFHWRLEKPLLEADLTTRSGDDVPIKVCVLFDMPTDKLGILDVGFLLFARGISADYVPAATLCYIWDHKLPADTLQPNSFTKRVRYLVLNSGDGALSTWISHERDLAKDFMLAFGDEADAVPPLIGVVVGADSDNTQSSSLAYLSDLDLHVVPPPPPVDSN